MRDHFGKLGRLFHRGINSGAAWAMAGTALKAGSAFLMLPLILVKLPPAELTLWYLFLSIAGLVGMVDLGVSSSFLRAVSYLWAGAPTLLAHGVAPVPEERRGQPNMEKLKELLATFRVYYLLLTPLLLLLYGVLGTWYIHEQVKELPNASWLVGVWLAYVAFQIFHVNTYCWHLTLAGTGGIAYGMRLVVVGQVINIVLTAACLLLNVGMASIVLGSVCGAVIVRSLAMKEAKKQTGLQKVAWSLANFEMVKVLWPQSWRVGLTAIGGAVAGYGSTLLCVGALGLAESASFALTGQVVGLLAVISAQLMEIKMPEMNYLRAHENDRELADLFVKRISAILYIFVAGSLGILFVAPPVLALLSPDKVLLPTPWLALCLFFCIVDTHQGRCASLVLSDNRNPLMMPYLINGLTSVLVGAVMVRYFGMAGLIVGNGLVQLSFNAWWIPLQAMKTLHLSPGEYFGMIWRALTHPRTILQPYSPPAS
jgi:O-antigen/teichoic acid export membrane protein